MEGWAWKTTELDKTQKLYLGGRRQGLFLTWNLCGWEFGKAILRGMRDQLLGKGQFRDLLFLSRVKLT